MIRNYLKIAWRNLVKEKAFTALNLTGLSLAFGAAILLSVYAGFELSYDRFHTDLDRIFQVYQTEQSPKGPVASISKPEPFARALQEEVPGVEAITRVNTKKKTVYVGNQQFLLLTTFVDPDFFSVFDFPVVRGKEQPVSGTSDIALSETTARLLFGDQEALGRTVTVQIGEEQVPFEVGSILKDPPSQSSLDFEAVLNFRSQADFAYKRVVGRWDHSNHQVFLKLAKGIQAAGFEKATAPFSEQHYADFIASAKRDGARADADGHYLQQRLLPLPDLHFARPENGLAVPHRMYPYLMLGTALLVLLIAGFNFVNMSLARGAQRVREIGMRKTMGAGKRQLFIQFWGESLLLFGAATGLGVLAAKGVMEPFQTLFRTRASFADIISPVTLAFAIVSLLLITMLAGGYPAAIVSRMNTIAALKGKRGPMRGIGLRRVFIAIQFGIALLLTCGTLILYSQLRYLRDRDPGFDTETVLAFPLNGKKSGEQNLDLLRNELEGIPGIMSVSGAAANLGRGLDNITSSSSMSFDYHGREVRTNLLLTDYDYVETLGLRLLKGRAFDRAHATDSSGVVINEAMARELGEPEVLGTRIAVEDSVLFTVIGVVEDYSFEGPDRAVEPMSLFLKPDLNMRYAFVRVAPGSTANAYQTLADAWKQVEPEAAFLGSFLDENIDRTLRNERNMASLISSGALLAVLLCCMGLFALSMIVVARRRKEIGVRKVVGASAGRITALLLGEFLRPLLVSFLIALPLAWYLGASWLANYAFRITLGPGLFMLAVLLTTGIALLTIGYRTLRAALANPVKSLRTE